MATTGEGIEIKNLYTAGDALAAGLQGVKVHGAPATGLGLHTNGHLGADLLFVRAGETFPVHTHPGDHLLLCVRGVGSVTVAGIPYEVRPGDIYLVEGNVPHAVGAYEDHLLVSIGAPHKAVDAPDRMAFVDWAGRKLDRPLDPRE